MKKFVLFIALLQIQHLIFNGNILGYFMAISVYLYACVLMDLKVKENPPPRPLSEKSQKYLSDKVESINIASAKKETNNEYSDQDLKYMGLYKN